MKKNERIRELEEQVEYLFDETELMGNSIVSLLDRVDRMEEEREQIGEYLADLFQRVTHLEHQDTVVIDTPPTHPDNMPDVDLSVPIKIGSADEYPYEPKDE